MFAKRAVVLVSLCLAAPLSAQSASDEAAAKVAAGTALKNVLKEFVAEVNASSSVVLAIARTPGQSDTKGNEKSHLKALFDNIVGAEAKIKGHATDTSYANADIISFWGDDEATVNPVVHKAKGEASGYARADAMFQSKSADAPAARSLALGASTAPGAFDVLLTTHVDISLQTALLPSVAVLSVSDVPIGGYDPFARSVFDSLTRASAATGLGTPGSQVLAGLTALGISPQDPTNRYFFVTATLDPVHGVTAQAVDRFGNVLFDGSAFQVGNTNGMWTATFSGDLSTLLTVTDGETLTITEEDYGSAAATDTTPEPASTTLIASGLAALAVVLRRQRGRLTTA